jgi:hypothetical protein
MGRWSVRCRRLDRLGRCMGQHDGDLHHLNPRPRARQTGPAAAQITHSGFAVGGERPCACGYRLVAALTLELAADPRRHARALLPARLSARRRDRRGRAGTRHDDGSHAAGMQGSAAMRPAQPLEQHSVRGNGAGPAGNRAGLA